MKDFVSKEEFKSVKDSAKEAKHDIHDWIKRENLNQIKQGSKTTKELQNYLNLEYNNLYPRLKDLEQQGLIRMSIEKNKAIWNVK